MADKEPRRRKKRRDSQKKEDVRHTEEQFFASMKSDSRESDQEVEEEIVSHHHHAAPSNLAKVVFVILFSGLVVSLSFIFISLRDVDKGPIDIFDMDHGGHHGEALHDEHVEDAVHDDDHHEEKSEVTIDDFIPGLSSIFSLNNEVIKEVESPEIPSQEEDKDEKIDRSETDIKPESSVDQGILEEYIEDIPAVSLGESLIEEPSSSSSEVYPETTIPASHSEEIYSTVDYAESEEVTTSLPSDEPELSSELFSSQEPEEISPVYNFVDEAEEIPPTESLFHMPEDLPTTASSDDVDEEDAFPLYEKADITNEADYEIRESLDVLDDIVIKSPDRALVKCEELLKQHPDSPRLHYIKAQALDSLAESHRSNKYLEEAIASYQKTMSSKNVPEELYLLAGKKAADRMRFRGFAGKSLKLLAEMSDKFPLDVELKNLVAVGYLLIGQNKLAKKVLLETLKISPESGFTKVHLGFILKTDEANYEDSIKYLSEGIATREKGVIDGRFYFHLGDALHRIGKNEEAMKVYEEAVKEGLFLSVYQRSLYNVDNLTGKPWWDPQSTKYAPDIKILEKNWITIRDEALSLISEKYSGFMPEAEGLQDKGDWKQLELFARGRKIEKNCQKAPKTCALISQIPDAANCKRGQVKFSIVHPGTHVWAHTGPTNCRLRAHLGLVVPQGVSIRVAEETRQWEEGKVILFDDSFEHEVWHNGSTYRLVLIVDFWHPELSAYQKRSLTPI